MRNNNLINLLFLGAGIFALYELYNRGKLPIKPKKFGKPQQKPIEPSKIVLF